MSEVNEILEIVKILMEKEIEPIIVRKSDAIGWYVEIDTVGFTDEDMRFLVDTFRFEIHSDGVMLVYSLKNRKEVI